jgi:uncharacterized membrane protein
VAIASGLNPLLAYIICVVTNMLVIPIVYFFLDYVHKYLIKLGWYKNTFDRFLERTREKIGPNIRRWEYLGLTLFVAIPLPVTGAYTGTLGAWFFGMDRKKSFIAIAQGVLIAGAIVTFAWLSGVTLLQLFIKKI